ncbi:MAG: hypothetical protein DRP46_13760, partial [Candidatus Zixiibacteriota bacterium]
RILALENGRAVLFGGNYSYYREKKESEKTAPVKKTTAPERIQQYVEFKKLSQAKGRIKKELRSTKSKIEDHEKTAARLERDIKYNIPKADWQKLADVSKQKSDIEDTLLELYSRLEELEKLDAEYSNPDG